MSRELQRLNINMPVELIAELDEYAEKMNVNRTAAINMLVSTALEQKNAMSLMDDMLKKLKDIEVMAKACK